MKKLLLAGILLIHLTAESASSPFLCFTDLTSGPSTGNSDNSQAGQIAGQDGAIVTVWGKNLGASKGSSQILVGNQVARVYSWRNATSPAELYSTLGLQMIEFQIPGTLTNGLTEIKVIVGGVTSNTLPFTVRNGNIYFLKTTGNDNTGNGSWSNPWATLDNLANTGALEKITSGDIIYVCDGVTHTDIAGDRSCVDIGNPGTEAAPKAIVGYPDATASIGNPTAESAYSLWVSGFGPTINWTISKLHMVSAGTVASMYHNFRVIGNKITAPAGTGPTGAVSGQGNHLYLLGNELTNIGFAGTSKLYHPIYIQSAELCAGPRLPTETDREIAWNNLHDNLSYDGINIYRECGSSAYMTNQRVHDNIIINQTGCGIRIGDYVTGENWIYNNLVINAGLGPNPLNAEAMHTPVYIHAGWEGTTTTIHFYNNTIYGGSFTGGAAWSHGMVAFSFSHPFDLDFRNNIIVSTVAGIGYTNPRSAIPPAGVENNIWYGAGTAPSWDISPLNINPMFVNPAGNNFRLQIGSQARDAARPISPTALQPLPPFDFDGNIRPQNNVTDLGAFEFEISAALPVTWVDVLAKRMNEWQAVVSWKVSDEQQVKDYIVQYSADNLGFTDGCAIPANGGIEYRCQVPANRNVGYYRVLQRDVNGRSSYSKTVVLKAYRTASTFRLMPNPAQAFTVLSYDIPDGSIINTAIYNARGELMMKQQFTADFSGRATLPVQQLAAGVYTVRIQSGQQTEILKLVRE